MVDRARIIFLLVGCLLTTRVYSIPEEVSKEPSTPPQNSTLDQSNNNTAQTQNASANVEPQTLNASLTNITTEAVPVTNTSESLDSSPDTSLESDEEDAKSTDELSDGGTTPADASSEENEDEKTEEKAKTEEAKVTKTQEEAKNKTEEKADSKTVENSDKTKAKKPIKKSDAKKKLCEICYCPPDKTGSPYVVDCTTLGLSSYPAWDEGLNTIPEVKIDFGHNSFRTVLALYPVSNVVTVNMAHNNIDSVTPCAFVSLPKLRKLSLAGNNLTTIHHSAFCGQDRSVQSALETLDLSGNSLVNLDDDLFECVKKLKWLRLAGNKIKVIDSLTQSALNTLFNLKTLDLSNNGLANLPTEIVNPINHLHVLNLSKNNFKQVPQILSKARALKDLNLSENPIEIFNSSSFSNLSTLTTLNISGMASLKSVTRGAFQSLTNLTNLYCRDNPQLTHFEPMAFNNETSDTEKYLEMVELRNNNISQIVEDIFYKTHVHNLDVRGNPIHCSCSIYWITVTGQIEMDSEIKAQTTCSYPEELSGKSLMDLDFKKMSCSDFSLHVKDSGMSSSYVFLLTMIIIVAFLVVGLLVFLIKTQSAKRYRALSKETSVQYTVSRDNNGFESINCDEIEEYSRFPSYK